MLLTGKIYGTAILICVATINYSQTKTNVKKPVKKTVATTKTQAVKKETVVVTEKPLVKDTVQGKKVEPPMKATMNVINDSLVQYDNRTWLSTNLRTSFYANGDSIPEAKTYADWKRLNKERKGCWCYYDFNHSPSFTKKYGKLYNYYACVDKRGLAPKGFHVPTEQEWMDLAEKLGGTGIAGKRMKAPEDWYTEASGDNSAKFNVIPGGMLKASPSAAEENAYEYEFRDANPGFNAFFWILTEKDASEEYPHYAKSFNVFHKGGWVQVLTVNYKECGLSVRCIKD